MLDEQMTSPPPPFVESLHWLMVTAWAGVCVPLAVHVRPTSVPPLADPLHCVIVAPVVVAGKGSQPLVIPSPDPTHWLMVTGVDVALTPTKVLVTWTLQRRVPPPPLVAPLHCVTAVSGSASTFVCTVHAASGSPAAP